MTDDRWDVPLDPPVGLPWLRSTLRRENPREQGLLGLADAIAWFVHAGMQVSLPLIDSQPYDLVVDGEVGLQRVQVKTTTCRSPRGIYVVSLATRGGNQSFHTSKDFDPDSCDLLYVLADDGSRYVIPASVVTARTQLNLGDKVTRFQVTPARDRP